MCFIVRWNVASYLKIIYLLKSIIIIIFPQRVGCDRVLGSTSVPDACGVCKGDNSTCKIYKGQYTKQHYTNRKSE